MLPIRGTVGRFSNHDVAVALSDPVVEKAPAIRFKVEEGISNHSTYEHPSIWVDPTTNQSRVAAVSRVINISFCRSNCEIKVVWNNSSVLRINRRINRRVKITRAEFTNDRAAIPLIMKNGNIVISDNVALDYPMLLTSKIDRVIESRRVIIGINVGRT